VTRLIALLVAFGFTIPCLAGGWLVEGRVVGLSDGDTITILDSARIRHTIGIAGIDAPESE